MMDDLIHDHLSSGMIQIPIPCKSKEHSKKIRRFHPKLFFLVGHRIIIQNLSSYHFNRQIDSGSLISSRVWSHFFLSTKALDAPTGKKHTCHRSTFSKRPARRQPQSSKNCRTQKSEKKWRPFKPLLKVGWNMPKETHLFSAIHIGAP